MPDALVQVLLDAVGALELGNWRRILRPPVLGGQRIDGPPHLVRWAVALLLVARSMRLQARGRLGDAWERLGEAAALLPAQFSRRDPSTGEVRAVLRPMPAGSAPAEAQLVARISRLIWREMAELDELRFRFAPGKRKPQDELVEAYIHYLMWVFDDPWTFDSATVREPIWNDDPVDASRARMCLFGTEIRWFANPAEGGRLSQSPWADIGGYRGLVAEALDRLADRETPACWYGDEGTSGLVVRLGRLRAWERARRRREDLDPS